PRTELGEDTRLRWCWKRLAANSFAFHRWRSLRNLPVRSWFSARARKTAREAHALPRKILRRAFTSVHKDEFIAIEQQPTSVGEAVATGIIGELGALFPRRRPAQREFKRALHLRLDSTGFTSQASGEMFTLARDERAVPQCQGLLHCHAGRACGGELIASR